jgi:hypothetical protein
VARFSTSPAQITGLDNWNNGFLLSWISDYPSMTAPLMFLNNRKREAHTTVPTIHPI